MNEAASTFEFVDSAGLDAKIFQPIALHLSPDGKPVQPDPDNPETRPRTLSAAPPSQTGEGSIEQVAPYPRVPRNRSSELEENRSHTGATISMHTPGRLPLYRQGAVATETGGESPRGHAPPRPEPQNATKAHHRGSKVDQALPPPSSGKTKRKAPHPTKTMTRDADQRRSREGTVDSRSALAYAGTTLPRPRLSKSLNSAMLKGVLPPPEPTEGGAAAPPLPPRKHQRNHSRSSSLDLNLVFQDEKSSSVSSPRPVIPPRPTAQQVQQSKTQSMDMSSTEHDFADFSKFEATKAKSSSLKMDRRGVSLDYTNRTIEQSVPPVPPPRPSASEEDLVEEGVEDGKVSPCNLTNKERHLSGDTEAEKRREQFSKERKRHLSAPVSLGVAEIRTGDRKSVQARIRQEKEENTKLSRHNSEMQQELRTLTDQRLALEISLERLRPFTAS
nr:ralBP1-associated Eps domain-containing protein 2-like [Lytechinus pictus]